MKKLFVVLVLAMLLLTACGESNPLLGEWELTNADTFLSEADALEGMEDIMEMSGSFSFTEENTFEFAMDVDMNFKQMFEMMGMSEGLEMDAEHLVVTAVVDGDYELVDGDKVAFEVVDLTTNFEPKELCFTFMEQTQCMTEEDLASNFNMDDLNIEDELGESFYQVDGDSLIMWDGDCGGPEEDCALKLTKK